MPSLELAAGSHGYTGHRHSLISARNLARIAMLETGKMSRLFRRQFYNPDEAVAGELFNAKNCELKRRASVRAKWRFRSVPLRRQTSLALIWAFARGLKAHIDFCRTCGTTEQVAEKLGSEGGGGFNPRISSAKSTGGFSRSDALPELRRPSPFFRNL
jgi:hypothetical protein